MPAAKITTFTVRVPTELANQLKKVAEQRGFHPNRMIAVAIERFVEDVGLQTKIEDVIPPDTPESAGRKAQQARAIIDQASEILNGREEE